MGRKNYYQKQGMSGFAKAMITFSIIAVAALVVLVVTLNKSTGSFSTTTQNTSNNGYTLDKDMKLITGGKAAELDKAKLEKLEYPEGKVTLTAFIDYACPHCQDFDIATAPVTKKMVKDGTIDSYTIIPVAYQPVPYALLGQQTAMCVADMQPELFYGTHQTLMEEGSNNPDYSSLMKTLESKVGTYTTETKTCIKNNRYLNYGSWISQKAQEGGFSPIIEQGITGTPSIFLNTKKYSGNPDPKAFEADVLSVKETGELVEVSEMVVEE